MAYDASREDRFTRAPDAPDRGTAAGRRRHETNTGWYWLFLIPVVFTLLPWIYNTSSPELFGMPFFYWYQMAWVPITVIITLVVYRKTKGA
jgi:Protein of unknown function (DUF3311)